MAPSPDMQTFAGRLTSFDGPKQVNKRRASSQKKKQPTTSSWPHDNPTPEQLAKAGFFYKPSSSSQDSVTCFLCDKALDGWDTEDNPALEHLSHVPHCGWAINCCIEQRIQDMDRSEEDPLSEQMTEARRATYKNWWPHESKKGWKCKVKKMVDAGWCYTPIPEADDCVTCFYCGASLEGWEPKDDPWQEHRKRAPDCHFFTLIEDSMQQKTSTKSKKGRTSRTSKASRPSAQTLGLSAADESVIILENNTAAAAEEEEEESMMSVASTTSKTGKATRKNTKSKGAANRPKKGVKRAANSVNDSIISQQVEAQIERELEQPESEPDEPQEPAKPSKGRKATRSSTRSQPESKKAPTRRGRTAASKANTTARQSQESKAPDDLETSTLSVQPQRPTRGRKRMSDGSEKLESNSQSEPSSPPQQPVEEPTKAKPKSKAKSKRIPPNDVDDAADVDIPVDTKEVAKASSSKQAKKLGKGKRKPDARQANEESELTEEQEDQDNSAADPEPEDVAVGETKDVQHTEKPPEEPRQQATPPPADADVPTPTPTPQSSNAENQPPSSTQPASKRKSPAAIQVVQTPKASPTKNVNVIGGDQLSKDAWKPVDLEGVFIQSPSIAQLADKDGLNIDTIIQTLTSPEKDMTVEDWIKKNAGEAEERLRQECERMIGKFEDEGNRALNTMEGIQCA